MPHLQIGLLDKPCANVMSDESSQQKTIKPKKVATSLDSHHY